MVLHSRRPPHLAGPGPGHCAQLSEVMLEAWRGSPWVALLLLDPLTAFWDTLSWRGRDSSLLFLFKCVTQLPPTELSSF